MPTEILEAATIIASIQEDIIVEATLANNSLAANSLAGGISFSL
jgi:hypothetical protein